MISTMISLDAYEMLTRLGRGSGTAGSKPSGARPGKRSIMATETSGVAVTSPTDVGFKRELGLVGACGVILVYLLIAERGFRIATLAQIGRASCRERV